MAVYRLMVIHEVIALHEEDAWKKLVRYETDIIFHKMQNSPEIMQHPEIVLRSATAVKISDATSMERNNHGNIQKGKS